MKIKIIALAVIIILASVAGYFLMNKKGKTAEAPGTTSQSETSSAPKSLKDLLSAGLAQKCTYSTTDANGSTEGTSYISGGKVRGDFSSTVSSKTTVTHMINDGKTSYIWTDGETTGFKMTVEETAGTPGTTAQQEGSLQAGADFGQKYDYKCSAWVTDGSFFTPPATVKFTDFSEFLKGKTGQ